MLRKFLLISSFSVIAVATIVQNAREPYRNPNLSPSERVWDLLKRMTLEEKVSQMKNGAAAVDRLGIPAYDWWNETLLKIDVGVKREIDYQKVAAKAAESDAIIFVGGLAPSLEGEEMPVNLPGFRKGDRTDIELPKVQREMLKALKETGKPVIFCSMLRQCFGPFLGG